MENVFPRYNFSCNRLRKNCNLLHRDNLSLAASRRGRGGEVQRKGPSRVLQFFPYVGSLILEPQPHFMKTKREEKNNLKEKPWPSQPLDTEQHKSTCGLSSNSLHQICPRRNPLPIAICPPRTRTGTHIKDVACSQRH